MNVLYFMIDFAGLMVLPIVMFSFWRISKRDEFAQLRESGQKINLNLHNLLSGFKREPNDPLRASHVKLAKIGILHWVAIPVGLLIVLVLGMLTILWLGDT